MAQTTRIARMAQTTQTAQTAQTAQKANFDLDTLKLLTFRGKFLSANIPANDSRGYDLLNKQGQKFLNNIQYNYPMLWNWFLSQLNLVSQFSLLGCFSRLESDVLCAMNEILNIESLSPFAQHLLREELEKYYTLLCSGDTLLPAHFFTFASIQMSRTFPPILAGQLCKDFTEKILTARQCKSMVQMYHRLEPAQLRVVSAILENDGAGSALQSLWGYLCLPLTL